MPLSPHILTRLLASTIVKPISRRQALALLAAPAIVIAQSARPVITHGVQSGDPANDSALIWVRGDRPSRMIVEVSNDESFNRVTQWIEGPYLHEGTDFTARHVVENLPAGADIFYRVTLRDLPGRAWSEPVTGRVKTAPVSNRTNVKFFWSADMCGQGYGINPELDGMASFGAMASRTPDFFLHSGDTIYADGPLRESLTLAGGRIWRNVVTEAKSKVAESVDEFRGQYKYNLMDKNVRRFNSLVPQVWAWDDHEVTNNYSPGLDLANNANYTQKSVGVLTANGTRAYLEYAPMRINSHETQRVYRKISYGPLLDLFVLDLRTYRGPNTYNRQETEGPDTTMMGAEQRDWLKREVAASKAVWKVFACDMPLGLTVGDGRDAEGRARFENQANGDGPALGRELEFADLLAFLKQQEIRNTFWLTADVHYTAAHFYDPSKAQFTNFDPFWEFVSGPLNAASLGPGGFDNTFGFTRVFAKGGAGTVGVVPENQFYGEVSLDGASGDAKVTLFDSTNTALFSQTIPRQVR
jgi:alkaline phosphatase D